MKRPPARARIQWHTWMPWYEFSRLIGDAQDLDDRAAGLLPLAGGVIIMTLAAALLFPVLLVPCAVAGGLLTVGLLTGASHDGRRLVAGLRAAGLPSPRTLLRIGTRLAADDMKLLWSGRPSHAPILAVCRREAGRPHLSCCGRAKSRLAAVLRPKQGRQAHYPSGKHVLSDRLLEVRLLEPAEPRIRTLVVANDPEGGEDDVRTAPGN